MILIYPGCSLIGIRTETLIGLRIVESCFDEYNKPIVLTHGTDGKHGTASLHYVGQAFDIRSHDLLAVEKQQIEVKAKKNLGAQFDFFIEDFGLDNEHFHLEFQPK